MLFLAVLVVVSQGSTPAPPYRRLETESISEFGFKPEYAISGDILYTTSMNKCYAYSMKPLKKLWEYKVPGEAMDSQVSVGKHGVYITTGTNYAVTRGQLISLNPQNGKLQWVLGRTGPSCPVVEVGNTIYTSPGPNRLSSINLATRNPNWSVALKHSNTEAFRGGQIEFIAADSMGLVVNAGYTTYTFSAATGRPESVFSNTVGCVPSGSVVWVPMADGSVAINISSGKPIWHSRETCDLYPSRIGKLYVGLKGGSVIAIDSVTGRKVWSYLVNKSGAMSGGDFVAGLGDKLFVSVLRQSSIFNTYGVQLWKGAEEAAFPQPCWTDGHTLVTFDGRRLMRFASGSEPAFPNQSEARRAIARRLAANFDNLDGSDKARLVSLGKDAFEALLATFLDTYRADHSEQDSNRSFHQYSKGHDLEGLLLKVATRENGPRLVEAFSKLPTTNSGRSLLMAVIAKCGDPRIVTQIFLKEIEDSKTPGYEMYDSSTFISRQYILQSKDPRAVAFLLKTLRNPKGDFTIREEAYWHLAGTGGEEGIRTILSMRHHRERLPSLEDRVTTGYLNAGEFGAGTKVLAERSDVSGHHWGLLQSGVLGHAGDLWLAEKVRGKWSHPLFSGVSYGGSDRHWKPAKPEAKIGGKTGAQLVAGAWFDVLVNSKAIRQDSDGDGLTDLEEARLGLDPHKADTDGDGDSDGVDPWPNASGVAETDLQKVLAAVFEARYHFNTSEGPAILTMPKEVKPFEMPGRKGPTLWKADNHPEQFDDLERCYENGVAFIGFSSEKPTKGNPWEANLLTWNKDRTEATLIISTYFGGLNGTGYRAVVRKFGSDWVVASMDMAFIS